MSFNCTAKDEIISSKLFIEASAGTGKTYVIEHYVVRAVLEASLNQTEIDPKKFAIITFTKAVARELRLRVKKALKRALEYYQGDGCENDAPEYFSLYPNKQQAARALSSFLDGLGNACITTIHGFCERLLTIWSEQSGEDEGTWENSQRKWLEEFLQETSSISVDEWNILGKNDFYDHNYFLGRVLTLMDDPSIENTLSREEEIQLLKSAVDACKNDFPSSLPCAASILKLYAKQFRGNCTKEGELHKPKNDLFNALQCLLEELSRDSGDRNFWELALEPFFKLRINLAALFEVPLRTFTPLEETEYRFFRALLEQVWPHIHALIDPEAIRKRIAVKAAKAFFAYTSTYKKKTFETLIRRSLALVKNELFCGCARSAFSCVIVDEFQDTDITQLELFSSLFLNDSWKGSILFVGDPKQAIYAFRKADVYTYMRARDLLRDSVRTLSINHRASSPMVEALNTLFAGPEHPFIFFLPKESRSLPHHKNTSAARIEPLTLGGRSAIHFVMAKDTLGRKRNWPHESVEKKFFLWMHDELIALEQEGVPFRDQAILVKDRYQARRVEEFLSSKNIPTCCWRLDLVTESSIYQWLKKVFSLLLQPKDKKRLLSLLFSMEGQEEACSQIARENNLTLFALAVVEWEKVRDAFTSFGIGGLKRALFACRYNGQECLHTYFGQRKKEEQLDLEQILEALSFIEGKVPNDIGAFSEALEHLEEYFSEDRDALLRRVDPEDKDVPILTMHRSKGLEFDVVYALGASSRTPQSEGDLEEIDAEKLRQIYVALTRAKKRSYIPLFLEQEGKSVPRGQAAPLELLLSCLSVGKNGSLDMWADALYQSLAPDMQEQAVKTLAAHHPQEVSFSYAEEASGKVYDRKEKDPLQESSTGPLLGSWRNMSSFSSQKEKSLLTTHASISVGGALFGVQFHEAIASLLQDSGGEEQCENNELASLLDHALHVQLPSLPPLHEISRDKIRCEVPFLFKERGGYICGTIDVAVLFDSKIYVIDWKTQEVDMPLRQYILEERYDLQFSIYKRAVEAAFPQYFFGGFFFVFVRNLALGKESIVEGGAVCS